MIRRLGWDSEFFGKKIGQLRLQKNQSPAALRAELNTAAVEGFEYISCKLISPGLHQIRKLESQRFYLVDIGVTWEISSSVIPKDSRPARRSRREIPRPAGSADIPALQKIAKSLFLQSRFYLDPFFGAKEADRLYAAWIANSVSGEAADAVFCVGNAGFITCKKGRSLSGEIVLVGVSRNRRGRGIGTLLVWEALAWFAGQGIENVRVRTQLRNTPGMNFYRSLGFEIYQSDIIWGKVLR